jgi:2-keto-3-deoxy-L-rhamnonate aldolase RhmA
VAEANSPPPGRRGAAFYPRGHRYTFERGRAALARADREVVVGVQIESMAAVESAAEILDTPGLDFAFVGPTDLSVDHGSADPRDPWVADAIARVGALGLERSLPMAIYAGDAETAARYVACGYRIVAVGIVALLAASARTFTDAVRSIR